MNDFIPFFLAMIPVAGLILALGIFHIPAHWATLGSLGATALLASLFWNMPGAHLLGSAAEGMAFALWPIMIVIIAAIFTYYLAEKTGALETIKKMLMSITSDKRIQVLILAWGFGGFLEAVAGYGTAVAVPASILIVLGFHPLFAAVISLIANTVPTAFGAVGIPVSTLAAITDLDPMQLSLNIGLQLTPFIILIPFVLVMLTGGGFKALRGVWGITFAAGLSFAIPHLLCAIFLGPELPAVIGSMASLVTVIVYAKVFHREDSSSTGIHLKQGILAWLPYLLVFAFILLSLIPPVHQFLSYAKSSFVFFQGGHPVIFKWIATPGVLIILAAILGSLIQGASLSTIIKIFVQTVWKLRMSALTVMCILAMAKIMDYSGMVKEISQALAFSTGNLFPFFSPMIGALGTFITGSDTSSNILFGKLQAEVAVNTHAQPVWLAAANTTGATAGKMISPQSIAVATGATNLIGQEGKILGRTVVFCLGYVVLLGALVFLGKSFVG